MNPYFRSAFIGFCFLLSGCYNDLELDFPEHKSLLVVNSVFNPDSLWKVNLTASRGLPKLDPFPVVEGATVLLYRGQQRVDSLVYRGQGIYGSRHSKPEVPGPYTIRVSAPGYPAAEATDVLPARPAVQGVEVDRSGVGLPEPRVRVTFALNDLKAEENYYFLYLYYPQEHQGRSFLSPLSFNFADPLQETYDFQNRRLFPDKTFNGKNHRLRVEYRYWEGQEVEVRLGQVSKAYYDYFRSKYLHQVHQDNVLTEPIQVSNNIRGGYGVFAGFNVWEYRIE
ncbi:hypothetical protein BH24BAC1_BH24BAC1_39190 [soil metagenome]